MEFIKPTTITEAMLLGTNVPETDYGEWSGTFTLAALGGTSRNWRGMCAAPGGNIYACVFNGDIYMQTAGAGAFTALGGTTRYWGGMCAAPNGNIYACVDDNGTGADVYMQTAGAGAFSALSTGLINLKGMCAAPNGNIYVCKNGGDIYMQTAGTGAFAALGGTSRNWTGMCAAPNGNIYACVGGGSAGDIYMQTAGSGEFAALGGTVRNWQGMCADANGNIFASVSSGDIYVRWKGAGAFVALSQSARAWRGMCVSPSEVLYAAAYGGDIYTDGVDIFYEDGDYVIKASEHKIYESLTNANYNHDPASDATNWLEVGATNRWKCFDGTIGNQSSQATPLIHILAPGAIDSIALLNIESTSVEIVEIDEADDLVTNGEDFTGATGTTQPTGWSKVGTPSNYTIDGGAIRITADAANEGMSQTITVSAATKYQLLFKYRNTADDIAQVAVYDATHSANILATTDLASSIVESVYSYVFTTPAGCTSIRISLMAKANGDIVWFDYVKLAPTEYSETVATGSSKTDVVKTDLVQKAAGIITVTINYTAGTAKLGELIVGVKTSIGTMRYSPTIGITDYSTKEVDVYGHYSIVQRSFAKRMTCSLIILNTAIDEVVRLLSLYRATELVWIGDENYNSLIVYGYYKDFQVVFSRPLSSDCSLEIEGLT